MKRIFLLLFVLLCIQANTQTLSVRDNSSREALSNVLFKDKNEKLVSSNNKGEADISELDKTGEISVYHLSYLPYLLTEE